MATNYAKASYTEVYDLHTEVGAPTIIGVHTPDGERAREYMGGFFEQFKKFRYAGASITFVPASTLPADPLQVSYEAGEPTIDPRDMVNPILHCGMHGESLSAYLQDRFFTNLYDNGAQDGIDVGMEFPGDAHAYDNLYYTALTDNTFSKSHVQEGFSKKGLFPLVYDMATNRMMGGQVGCARRGDLDANQPTGAGTNYDDTYIAPGFAFGEEITQNSGELVKYTPRLLDTQFFTPRKSRLGWMDTSTNMIDARTLAYGRDIFNNIDGSPSSNSKAIYSVRWTEIPKLFMYLIMLPPAYKTEFYFRVVVRHYLEFKDFRSSKGVFAHADANTSGVTGLPADPISANTANAASTLSLINGQAQLTAIGVN